MSKNIAVPHDSGAPESVPPDDDVFQASLHTPPTNDLVTRVAAHASGRHGHGYSREAATLFAIACGWSYGDGQTLVDVLYRCGFQGTCRRVSVASGALFVDTDAYILRGREFAVVVFRGTEIGDAKIIDALSDFYSTPVPFLGRTGLGQVHEGFQLAYLPIHDRIVDVLQREADDVPALFVCGHSLGGALAVLAVAAMFQGTDAACGQLQSKLRGVYTYGQPMVGDGLFARKCQQQFGERTFRHVFQRDLIPHLPPSWTTGEFMHFGHEYRGTRHQKWTKSDENVAQVRTAVAPLALAAAAFVGNQVKGLKWLASRVAYSFDDHRPQAYIDCSKLSTTGFVFP